MSLPIKAKRAKSAGKTCRQACVLLSTDGIFIIAGYMPDCKRRIVPNEYDRTDTGNTLEGVYIREHETIVCAFIIPARS